MAKYQSTKTYGTDRGLSCCFRQWRASHSHCSTLHGYSLGFKFVFESETLDSRNWAFDFGGMRPIKQYLDYMFDHTVLVSNDDPALPMFRQLARYSTIDEYDGVKRKNQDGDYELKYSTHDAPTMMEGRVCDLRVVDGVGCEMTAKMVFEKATEILEKMKSGEDTRYDINPDVRLVSVECFEHAGNSALYIDDNITNPVSERKVFTVDVGEMTTAAVTQLLDQVKEELHKHREPQTVSSHDVALKQLETLMSVVDQVDFSDVKFFVNRLTQILKK